jgi:hypothetical protein
MTSLQGWWQLTATAALQEHIPINPTTLAVMRFIRALPGVPPAPLSTLDLEAPLSGPLGG